MHKFLSVIGRVGHVVLQVGLLGAQGYAAYLNGGKVGAANFVIGAIQVYAADQARMEPPPESAKPEPKPPQPKEN